MESRTYVMLRAIEWGLGAAVVVALIAAINGGWLTSSAQKFSDWYASEVNGLVEITVVDTSVTLPQVERTDLPIPQRPNPAFSAAEDDTPTTPEPGTS